MRVDARPAWLPAVAPSRIRMVSMSGQLVGWIVDQSMFDRVSTGFDRQAIKWVIGFGVLIDWLVD